jgi:hypothetical protein
LEKTFNEDFLYLNKLKNGIPAVLNKIRNLKTKFSL